MCGASQRTDLSCYIYTHTHICMCAQTCLISVTLLIDLLLSQEMPAPGSYNVHHSYDKSQVKTTIALPRSKTAKQKHSSFLSAATRFSALKDVGSTSVDPDNPGQSILYTNVFCTVKCRLFITQRSTVYDSWHDVIDTNLASVWNAEDANNSMKFINKKRQCYS